MALNFDDRILGGKVENYVSSSEESEDEASKAGNVPAAMAQEIFSSGRANRTGPKGVLEDYQEYRRQEKEQRIEQQANFYARLKETAMTVKTDREEQEERKQLEVELEKAKTDEEDDEFMKEYRLRRMREMYKAQQATMSRFGALLSLDAENFVAEIDKESPQTLVIVHVYEPNMPSCDAMNGCLIVLASDHPSVKFCRVRASTVKMSSKFLTKGLPTLLVYQNKQLINCFVSVTQYLGNDFFARNVETFLQEHGLLCENEPGKMLGSPTVPKQPSQTAKVPERKQSEEDDDDDEY